MVDWRTPTKASPHTECVVCQEARPGRQEGGSYAGPLPADWQFCGEPDGLGGILSRLTCSSACRFLGGFNRGPFDP